MSASPTEPAAPLDVLREADVHLERVRLHEAAGDWQAALASFRRYAALREAWLVARAAAQPSPAAAPPSAAPSSAPFAPGGLPTLAAQLAGRDPALPLTLLAVGPEHDGPPDARVARAVESLLRAQSRPQDAFALLADGRFVVVPGGVVSLSRATLVAERLRATVERHGWSALAPGLAVTASVAVVVADDGARLDEALARAGALLDACRRGGGNRVRCAD